MKFARTAKFFGKTVPFPRMAFAWCTVCAAVIIECCVIIEIGRSSKGLAELPMLKKIFLGLLWYPMLPLAVTVGWLSAILVGLVERFVRQP